MDPISAGAMKHVQQNVFEQAEQQIQKSNQSISDFEKLREQLENQDAISNQQANQTNAANQMDQAQQNEQINQIDPSNSDLKVQKAGNLQDVAGIPEIKNTGELEAAINHIRNGQARLNELIESATSGKTYSPQEMLALTAEIGKITNDLELATKIVGQATEGLKQVLNLPM